MSDPKTSTSIAAVVDATAPTRFAGINREQLELLKRTLAQGTTDDEFSLFMNTATRLGLDPFARQIYAIKRWNPAARTETMAIQVAIDGFRAIGEATGEMDGQDPPMWCGADGEWVDAWVHDKPPAAAKVVVYRKGVPRGYVGIATYKSFVQTNKDGGPTKTWATMPDVMLAKCAESQALRKAFPQQLAGVHTPDEMGQADNAEPAAVMQALPTMKRADAAPVVDVPAKTEAPPAFDFALAIAQAKTLDALTAIGKRIAAEVPEANRAALKPSYEARLAILNGPDPFAAFLADLGGMLGAETAGWTADDVALEFIDQIRNLTTLAEVNAAALPWVQIASKPGRGPVVRNVKAAIEAAAEARRVELRGAAA